MILGPWMYEDEEERPEMSTGKSKTYTEKTINGLKAVATNNERRRERAVNALVGLAKPSRRRK